MPLRVELSGRHATLLAPYWRKADGVRLYADAGFTTDGATIPRPWWPATGHPFAPVNVGPAVLHDAECQRRRFCSSEVHRLFFVLLRDQVLLDFAVAPRWFRGRSLARSIAHRLHWEWRRFWRHVHALALYLAVRWFGPSFPAR